MIGKRSAGRIEEGTSQEEGGRTQEGSGQSSKEKWAEGSTRRSEKALQISARNCCLETDQEISKVHGAFDQKAALSAIGARDCK